jgi:hypothetical protein
MLILIAEKLHHSPSTEYSKVLEFLGARSEHIFSHVRYLLH